MSGKKGRSGGKRDGAKRPTEIQDPVRIGLVMERRDRDAVDALAGPHHRSEFIREAVREWVERGRGGESR